MSENQTHAESNIKTILTNKIDPFKELEYGTISITYDTSWSWFPWFAKSKKPKNAKDMIFCFESEKITINKHEVKKLDYFDVTHSGTSPCPLELSNIKNNKKYLKMVSSIRKENPDYTSDLKILSSHPAYSNIVKTQYNCLYQMHDMKYSGHVKYILGLGCIGSDANMIKFMFAYNQTELDIKQVSYILLGILCGNF